MINSLKYYINQHISQIVIFGISTAILAGIAVLATGDMGQIFAGKHRH